jgi:hypothetical protein
MLIFHIFKGVYAFCSSVKLYVLVKIVNITHFANYDTYRVEDFYPFDVSEIASPSESAHVIEQCLAPSRAGIQY